MTDSQRTASIGGYERKAWAIRAYGDLVDGRFVPEHLCVRKASYETVSHSLLRTIIRTLQNREEGGDLLRCRAATSPSPP